MTPEENAKMGVTYVIGNGQGEGRRVQTQIGWGCAESKAAEGHCPITLTAEEPAPERTGQPYYILFHNIGNGQKNQDYFNYYENTADHDSGLCSWQWEATDEKEASAYAGDLLKTLPEDKRAELKNVPGYDFAGFRLAYYNAVDDVWTEQYSMNFYGAEDVVSLDDVKDYTFYDGWNYCIMFSAVYEPKQYTVKFNNIGNVDSGENEHYWYCQSKENMWFGDNFWDYMPDPEDTESWPNLMVTENGDVFSHWRVLDFSKDYNDVNENGERFYSGIEMDYNGTYFPLDENIINFAVEGTEEEGNKEDCPYITLRAVYESADTVRYSGTVGDNIPWQLTADGTLTVGRIGDAVDGEGSYSIPDWENPGDYYAMNEEEANQAIADGRFAPWLPYHGEITALVIGSDIADIGNHSFQDMDKVAELTVPGNVKRIGEWAFHNNNFVTVTIAEGVTNIAAYAFNESHNITTIHIPASVWYISEEAFKECYELATFTVADGSTEHTAVDGVLFTKDMTALIRYPWAKPDTSYTVPDGVTLLKATCFEASGNLTEIILPESLDTIEWWALAELNVSELVIPASVNSVQDSAFRNCYNLTDIYFQGNKPDDWQGNLFTLYNEDGDYDYFNENIRIHYNAAAERWGDIVGEYGDNMVIDGGYRVEFVDDDGVTSVIDEQILAINNTITVPAAPAKDYGSFARWFAWERDYTTTDNGTTITLTQDLLNEAGYDTNWDGVNDTIVFEAQYDLDENAPEFRAEGWIDTDEDGTDDIHWFVEWNRNLTVESTNDNKVSIPDYSNENPAPWHDYASYIRSVNIWNNIDRIGSYAFADLFVLDGVNIPGDVKSIGTCAFYNCTNISWINIGDGVERIEHDVFCGVNMYNHIWIPASVTDMNDNAFISCRVNRFEVDGNNQNYWNDEQGILYKRNGDGTSTLLEYPKNDGRQAVVIPEGVTTIHEWAFEDAWDVRSVQLPETLQTIENYAFRNSNLCMVHIPAGVNSIGEEAFRYNWGLEGAYFYGNVPTMGNDVFTDTSGDFRIYYLNGKSGFDGLGYNTDTFSATDDYASGVIDYDWNDEHIHLEWNITKDGWLNVVGEGSIPDHEHPWWDYLAYVRHVDIDDRITYIGNNTFCDLTYVDTINLPADVTFIGDGAFRGGVGNSIGSLVLPGKVESIGSEAFCRLGITKVTIPDTTNWICDNVFRENPIETYVVTSGNEYATDSYGALYELGENGELLNLVAYPNASAFTEYKVPDGITMFYNYAIFNAENLTNIILPDSLTWIGREGIVHSHSLTTLTIPAGVVDVEQNAFSWNDLASVTFLGNKPNFWDNCDSFEGNSDGFTIYYYEGTTGWDDYDMYPTYMLQAGEEPFVARGHVDGTNIDWTIDKDGVLTVFGEGGIPDNVWEWREYIDTMVKKIHIEDGITGIGDNAFWNDADGITELTLPNTLKYIGTNAFQCNGENGNRFGELVLPEGLERIEYHAFYNCGLTKVTIPSTMQEFDAASFEKNPIEAYAVAEGNPEFATDEYGVLFQLWYDEDDQGNRIDGTGKFGVLAAYPSGLSMTSYTVPDTVGDIQWWAFSYANNLTTLNLNNAWGYNDHSINCCDNLTSLVLPENIDWMSPEAIYGNKNLHSVTFSGNIPDFHADEDGNIVPFYGNADDFVVYFYDDEENVQKLSDSGMFAKYSFIALPNSNLKGDVNDDGKVDEDDLTILQKHFAGYDVYFVGANADIDGENGLTRRDVMILARYLANWGEAYSKYFN